MTGISKSFDAVEALSNVDLRVEGGTMHAVVGENGAGKTTLMRILYGALQPDSGALSIEGAQQRFASSKAAIESGIGMVSQHYGIIGELTCLQNLMLGAEGGALISTAKATERAEALAKQMGFQFDWRRKSGELSPAGAQKLEILKLLWRNARIMILDEPTSMLSPADADALFSSLKQLVAKGSTVILVTHRLPEVMEHCSHVTVLRAGVCVADKTVAETETAELARLIVGGKIAEPPPRTGQTGKVLLDVSNLELIGGRGRRALKNVSVSVKAGETVGIAGVDGSGQRELFQIISGLLRPEGGSLALDGLAAARKSASARIAMGLRTIPEDRHAEGVIETWSLEENTALGLHRLPPFARGGFLEVKARRQAAAEIAERFATKHGGLSMPIESLSGGNQQRFVAARALYLDPRLILAFQPARGLDINSTTRVYEGIRAACEKGAGALVVSYDLDELLEYCDRVVVMNRGELLEPATAQSRDRDAIGRLMVGAA